jgi:hypothetical protein
MNLRPHLRIGCLLVLALGLQAATLEYLSLDEIAGKSTAIVRGRVVSTGTGARGALIYTRYTVQVLERLKGPESSQVDVVVLGGASQGLSQTFSGAPQLGSGVEYVLFLWTGPSGLTQIIGLSQGVFRLQKDDQGELIATRAAASETMLDPKTGRLVNDQAIRLRLTDLRSRVRTAANRGGQTQ